MRKEFAFVPRNEAVKACKRLGRIIWKRRSGYHQRSLVETKMNRFKRLGEKVMASTFERQVAEFNIAHPSQSIHRTGHTTNRWLCHSYVWGWGRLGLRADYATKPETCGR